MSDALDLNGSVAMVTGAGSGIGAAIAREMRRRGASVALVGRRLGSLEATANQIGQGTDTCFAADVSDYISLAGAVTAILGRFGRVDHLINNAGTIEPIAPILDADPDLWARSLAVNLSGPFNAVRLLIPHMQPRNSGTIINISSGAAERPMTGWSAYCAAKAGLAMFTRVLIEENAGNGLRIFGFVPGAVDTGMLERVRESQINEISRIPRETLTPPELPARAVAWLCTAAASDLPNGPQNIRDPQLRQRVGLPHRSSW